MPIFLTCGDPRINHMENVLSLTALLSSFDTRLFFLWVWSLLLLLLLPSFFLSMIEFSSESCFLMIGPKYDGLNVVIFVLVRVQVWFDLAPNYLSSCLSMLSIMLSSKITVWINHSHPTIISLHYPAFTSLHCRKEYHYMLKFGLGFEWCIFTLREIF